MSHSAIRPDPLILIASEPLTFERSDWMESVVAFFLSSLCVNHLRDILVFVLASDSFKY